MTFPCPECGYQFTTNSNLRRHIRTRHEIGDKPKFTCPECNNSFTRKFHLERHLSIHSRPQLQRSTPPSVSSSSSLPQPTPSTSGQCPPLPPLPSASPPPRIQCGICGQSYNWQRGLRRHFRMSHGNIESTMSFQQMMISTNQLGTFPCSECGCQFTDRSNLRRHEREKHQMKIPCLKCGLHFTNRSSLISHQREIHEDSRIKSGGPFPCSECGYHFTNYYNMKRHMRNKHSVGDKRILICNECGKSFGDKTALKRHLSIHSKSSSSSLHQPTPSTSGQCPPPPPPASAPPKHRCTSCGKSYKNRGDLNRHLWSSHGVIGSTESVCQIAPTDKPYQTERPGESGLSEEDLEAATILMTMSGASTSTAMPPDTPHPYGNDQSRIPPDLPVRVQRWTDESSGEDQDIITSSSLGSMFDTLEDQAVDSSS